MSLQWFQPPTPSGDTLEVILMRLHALGVRWQNWDAPSVLYRVEDGELVAEIGAITVEPSSGEIRVWPYRNIGDTYARVLAGCAQDAFETPPSKARSWGYYRRGTPKWQCSIVVHADEDGGLGQRIVRHQRRMETDLGIAMQQTLLDVAP